MTNIKVSFGGAADFDEELELGERVVFVIDGTVGQKGEKETASAGIQEFAKVRTGTVVRLTGAEFNTWKERIAAVQHQRDGGEQRTITDAIDNREAPDDEDLDGLDEDDEDVLA